jgi:hypothetical protein
MHQNISSWKCFLESFQAVRALAGRLLEVFAGQNLTFYDLVQKEAAETQSTDTNYRDAVLQLEAEFRVLVDPPAEARRMQRGGVKRTLPGESTLRFPD